MEYSKDYFGKIMEYTGNDWEEFVALFTDEEVEDMKLAENMENYELTNKEETIYAFITEWLIENIRNRTISGTKQLLRLSYIV